MKKYNLLFLVIAFSLVGSAQTFAGDLLQNQPYWPKEERNYQPQVDSEKRYTIGGAATGAIIASVVSNNDMVRVGGAVLGAMVGNGIGVGKQRRMETTQASAPRNNCRVVSIYRTNPRTGQTEAQQEQTCDEMVRREVPLADMVAPGAISYKHDGAETVDPLSSLSEEERNAVIELRKQKQATPALQPNVGSASPTNLTRTSYTTGCQRYVNGMINPGC